LAHSGIMNDIAKVRAELSSVPELPTRSTDIGLLVPYQGARPDYPAWALAALADVPQRSSVNSNGAAIEVLTWGKPGDPGVLLLHGNGASADWWSFLAPTLAKAGYRVVAMSFSGMGGSDWRSVYQMHTFVAEILAVIEATQLATPTSLPVLAGHSFGGFPALMASMKHHDKIGGLILLDTGIEPPGEEWTGPPKRTAPNRVYATMTEALARFRLAPPQPCDNHWALDHIARTSLKQVDGGWTWKFDPFLWNDFKFERVSDVVGDLKVPTIIMRGSSSYLMADRIWNFMKSVLPANAGYVTIPQASHHVMLDQPLATLAALEGALAGLSILPKPQVQG
jgi:pimeloyl-ACP methyl ester carboxylesterase